MQPDINNLKLSLLPHETISANNAKIKDLEPCKRSMGPCQILLDAKLKPAPSSEEEAGQKDSCIYLRFELEDRTNLRVCSREIIPEALSVDYCLRCPLTEKPLWCLFSMKTSRLRPLQMNIEYPVKREHLRYFETEINCFLGEILSALPEGKHVVMVSVSAHIERDLWHDEAMEVLKEIESEGAWNRSADQGTNETEGCLECVVCLGDVRLKWFEGFRLPCDHVFHVNCISPWLQSKETCPTCRCILF